MVSVELMKFHFNHSLFLSVFQSASLELHLLNVVALTSGRAQFDSSLFFHLVFVLFFSPPILIRFLRLKLNSFCAYFGLCIFSCFSLVFVLGCVHVDSSFFTSHHLHQNCVLPPSIFSIKVVFAHLIRSQVRDTLYFCPYRLSTTSPHQNPV